MKTESKNRDIKREKRTNSQEEPARVYRPRTLTLKSVKADEGNADEAKEFATPQTDEIQGSANESQRKERHSRPIGKGKSSRTESESTYSPRSWRKRDEENSEFNSKREEENNHLFQNNSSKDKPSQRKPRESYGNEIRGKRNFAGDRRRDTRNRLNDKFEREHAGRFSQPERSFNSDKPSFFKKGEHHSDTSTHEGRRYKNAEKPYETRTLKKRNQVNLNDYIRDNEKAEGFVASKIDDGLIRLNRYIANSGICSRREADEYITAGHITVNGKVVTELGTKVKRDDEVCYKGNRLMSERKVYILLNKPKDYVTTVDDPHAKHTVMELIEGACSERVYPVGRLDRNSTGVLLLTNDGELTTRLTHPSFKKRKIYHVGLDKRVNPYDLDKILEGIELDGEKIQADAIDYVDGGDGYEVGIEIHSGQNRVVRRMFESLGYKVTKLDRVYFAGLTKKNVPRGKWRFLTQKEINMLKMNRFY